MNKEVTQLIRSIEHIEGIELRNTKNGHTAVYLQGKFVSSLSHTPSDNRWRQNTLATLRRAGITPATSPRGPAKAMLELMPVEVIKERILAMPNRSAFARFIVDEMPKLQPELRTYKNIESAVSSLSEMARREYGLRGWTHLLLDSALREWEQLPPAATNGAEAADPAEQPEAGSEPEEAGVTIEITDAWLDAAITADREKQATKLTSTPTLTPLTMVELAGEHTELTERVEKLAESVRSLTAQLDELVAKREAVAAEILSRLSETEGRP